MGRRNIAGCHTIPDQLDALDGARGQRADGGQLHLGVPCEGARDGAELRRKIVVNEKDLHRGPAPSQGNAQQLNKWLQSFFPDASCRCTGDSQILKRLSSFIARP
jgi:hypothetical protein